MIRIILKNGEKVEWERKNYDDYKYDGKCFIIVKECQWVGIYNMDSIISVVVVPAE